MTFNYLSRLQGAARRSLCRTESGIQNQVDGLISRVKLSLVYLRQSHSLSSGAFTNLRVFVPLVAIAARKTLPLTNKRNNLLTIATFSRGMFLPSVSGASFQVCGYHVESVLPESGQNINYQEARMALRGSTLAIVDCSIKNVNCRPRGPGLAAYHSCSSHGSRGYGGYSKASSMSMRNKEQPTNFLLYGYFMYNGLGRKDYCYPLFRLDFEGFHISSPAFSSTCNTPNVSFHNAVSDEVHSCSGGSSESNTAVERTLKLNSASCYLPHPDKEETGGEDAHFICTDEQALGVADGVGGWADVGVDAGKYSRQLMSYSVNAIQEEPRGSINPARVLQKAHASTKVEGSSTACIIALIDQGLHAVNLGDSGFMVIRDGCTVFRSPVQQHDFNFPYQLENGDDGDSPSSGQVFNIPIAAGDVLVAGTDGLFDNLYNNDITTVVVHSIRAGLGPQVTAQKIATLAQQRALDKNRQTPFSAAAQEAGHRYHGGKLDDITVVVSYIITDQKENFSANSSN